MNVCILFFIDSELLDMAYAKYLLFFFSMPLRNLHVFL